MILLDSHVVIWLALAPERLSAQAAEAIRKAEPVKAGLAISAASFFEIATAVRRGRVILDIPIQVFAGRIKARFTVIPVTEEIALHAGVFADPFPGDPIDRVIAATAIVAQRTLVTADGLIRDAGVCRTIW